MNIGQSSHLYSVYFAPRGRERLLRLGSQLSLTHLNFNDNLIGIVGDAGSGKSSIIKGMFPGLELSNDDDGLNPGNIFRIRDIDRLDYSTYHIDMRFQTAFTQMYEIVDFVKRLLLEKRRVIIEHFDLIYPYLGVNANLLVGIGEEIIVTRPNIFGPCPKDIYDMVFASLKNRKMAHTAEDITFLVIQGETGATARPENGDVRGGFVLNFREKPDIDLSYLADKVRGIISRNLQVSYYNEDHIKLGDSDIIYCTGPRIHVRNTSEIENYRLLKEFIYDGNINMYSLVGLVGKDREEGDLNKITKEQL